MDLQEQTGCVQHWARLAFCHSNELRTQSESVGVEEKHYCDRRFSDLKKNKTKAFFSKLPCHWSCLKCAACLVFLSPWSRVLIMWLLQFLLHLNVGYWNKCRTQHVLTQFCMATVAVRAAPVLLLTSWADHGPPAHQNRTTTCTAESFSWDLKAASWGYELLLGRCIKSKANFVSGRHLGNFQRISFHYSNCCGQSRGTTPYPNDKCVISLRGHLKRISGLKVACCVFQVFSNWS